MGARRFALKSFASPVARTVTRTSAWAGSVTPMRSASESDSSTS